MGELTDDSALLETMMRGAENTSLMWQPSAYWRGYCARILRELDASGLAGARTNQAILKGFAAGGVLRPTEPAAAWKRTIWRALERLPGVRRVIAEYARTGRAEHRHHVSDRIRLARLLMDRLSEDFPELNPPDGLANGGAEDAFDWRGHTVTADWALFLVRAAGFYRALPSADIRSLVEVGPGLGLSTLAHAALIPKLRVVVNVDIPPVLYVSTQCLRSIDRFRVVDVREAAESQDVEPVARAPAVTVYQIAPWQLPDLLGSFDVFHNAYSFQEMEREICAHYANWVARHVTGHVWLMSSVAGHAPGAGGQTEPIPICFLEGLFSAAFPVERRIEYDLFDLYGDPREQVLLSHEGA